mgnify:CR=1 FL=1
MKHLSRLKLVPVLQKRNQNKIEIRRAKLIEKLEDQLAMAEALIRGDHFRKYKQVWGLDERGERIKVDRVKRIRAWYWISAAGCYLSIFYGSRVIKLDGENTAITVGPRDKLPDTIRAVIDAVKAGELDKNIEEVADKGIYILNSKVTSKTNIKAVKAAS